jgi:hypothetical protein
MALLGTRAALERCGPEAFMRACGTLADSDLDGPGRPRRPWVSHRRDDSDVVVIELVNSTPKPDGSFRRCWLRVPPLPRSCREAVAWTFGLAPDDYAPVFQS